MNQAEIRSLGEQAVQSRRLANLPSSTDWPRGPLHEPLLRSLLDELGSLGSQLEQLPKQLLVERGTEHDDAPMRAASRDSGWVLGVLAAASGFDLLQARREQRGLSILVEKITGLLAQEDCQLNEPKQPLPAEGDDRLHWQIPWAVANLLYLAGLNARPTGFDWSFSKDEGGFRLIASGQPGRALVEFANGLASSCEFARFSTNTDHWSLRFETDVQGARWDF